MKHRLIRLPVQLLVALINAMAVLLIVACVLVIVVLNRVDTASERITAEVTGAALARLQITPAAFKSRLDSLEGQIATLSAQLADPDLGNRGDLTRQLVELNGNLSGIRQAAKGLGAAGPQITATAFEQAGDLLTRALFALRGCAPVSGPDTPSS
ncbi:hypothetical protein [Labrenzia sp. 011]|uniref:hypothetical protein n=1 Tax=Labrenzia sp. 011 TaxID=2171494 RepID=UPI001AD8B162|nr:hypothetical protein [Labrenzia sp. 011]